MSPRGKKNRHTTKSGKTFKIKRSIADKFKIRKDSKVRRKAERLSNLPKGKVKRFFARMHPKRLKEYWLSRDGGVMALKVLGIGIIISFLFLVGLFAYFRKDLPNLRDISGDNIGGSIRYYDRTGKTLLWEDYDAVKRIPVEGDQISQNVKDATIAIEDQNFYQHGGFDVQGISRAAFSNVTGGGTTQGGSTITQQLVKLTQNWTQERTYTRKVKELILAVELERSYSKDEILTGYLNTAPYGGVEYGVEAAARGYFEKQAKDLTLDEAAMLAAIPKAPSTYSPYSPYFDKEAFIGRQHYILDLMEQQGKITTEQKEKAKSVNTLKKVKPRKPKYDGILAPWFVLAAKEQLEVERGAETSQVGGWKVITTVDMKLQKLAEEQVQAGIQQVYNQGGDTAAFAAEDVETGQMVALVGGVDFTNKDFGQNNYARLRLPPGSSFKPYDYATLIENTTNSGAGSVLYDTQGPLEGYPCTSKSRPPEGNCLWDYDFRYPGPLTIRYALGGSRNVPAVKAMLISGIDKTIETAESMGLKSGYNCYEDDTLTKEAQCYASSAIGDGAYLKLDEHVHALGTFSRLGKRVDQTYILKVEDSSGKALYEWEKQDGEQVIREDTAYIINDILSDPNASYMSRKMHRYNGWRFAMKTGTTNDAKDGWLTGYSSKYAAAVWVGYHTREVEMSGFMETMTQPIWGGWMEAAHADLEPKDWKKPNSVQTLDAYVVRNHVGVASVEPSPSQDLFPAWYDNNKERSRDKKTIDVVSNKLATECTPDRARKTITEAAADSFSSDPYVGTGGANTSEKDDVHKCDDRKPSVSLSIKDKGGGTYDLQATFSAGTHPLSSDKFKGTLTFSVNGSTLPGGTYEVDGSGTRTYKNYKANFNGTRTVRVVIVDSVLYDNSDSGSVSGVPASSPINITNGSTTSDANTTISWTGGTKPYTVIVNGSTECNTSSNSCTISTSGPPGTEYTVVVRDKNGEEDEVKITRN